MKCKKKIKIGIFSLLGLALLLFIVLIVHVGIMVHERGPLPMRTIQMARVDFNEPINSLQANHIQAKIRKFKGVKSTYFNQKNDILIYTYDNRKNNSKNIYSNFKNESSLLCSRYTVSKKELSYGCPAMNGNSFYGKLTRIVSKIVN